MAISITTHLPFVLDLFDDVLAAMPSQLVPLLQQNYLEKKFEDFAEPNELYASLADTETFAENIGTTLTKTRPGLKAPIQIVTGSALSIDDGVLNNGINPSEGAMEQYTLTPQTYEDGMDLDLIGMNFAIVDRFAHNVRVNSVQSFQSRDLLARNTLLSGYIECSSFVTSASPVTVAAGGAGTALGTPSTINIDDVRGLRNIVNNGTIQAVGNAAGFQLLCTVYPAGSVSGNYQIYVIGATTDAVTTTTTVFVGSGTPIGGATAAAARCNGLSGTLSVAIPGSAAGKTITKGDVIIANDAPKQFIAGAANLHWSSLSSGNLLTQGQILDAKAWLEDNAMEPLDDGTYLVIGSARSFRGLYGDADFKQAFQGLGQSPFFKRGRVDSYLGVTFLQTTNAPRIALAAGGYAHVPMMIGKGALVDAWFEGMLPWAASQYNDAYVAMNTGIAQVITPPIDRLRRKLKMSWITIRDMTAPTDVTVSSNVFLTAGGGRRKRCVLLPHYSSV